MDCRKAAMDVLKSVGGEENVISIMSCFTRVRVEVKNKESVDEAQIKKIEGYQGLNWSANTIQIIFGGHCNDVYDELEKLVHIKEDTNSGHQVVAKKQPVGAVIIDYIANSIQPIVPILIASGFLQSLLAMLNYLNVDTTTYTYQVLYSIGQAGYYFLPIFLGFAAAKKLRINPYLGALVGAVMVYPTIVELGGAGGTASFLGLPVTLVSYASSITPILISMPIVMLINKLAKKISPKVLSSLLVPIITMIVSVPVILIVTGPIATWISNGLCGIITFVFTKMSVVGGLIIGAVAPYLVMTGVHNGIALPITLTELASQGYSYFFPLLAYGNIAIGGAALGVWYKTKNSKLKTTAMSATVMAVVGITEPALFGVLLPTKKPLIALGIMDAICSAFSLVFGVKCTALSLCGLGGLPAFFGETFVIWCILMIVSFAGAFMIVNFVGFQDIPEEVEI
jgi:PTS system beta-glucosides-specific IIC component